MAKKNFFERQASARRNTGFLIFLFSIAVTLITLAVCVVGFYVTRSETQGVQFTDWMTQRQGLLTAGAVILLIFAGSFVRWIDLAGGGHRVARMVGARAIDPATQDADERRFRNIVEEMAIASGVPVPDLYVIDHETSINAFVAGYTPGEAIMAVTHGALTQLDRDELQGVVGHEFSHILNGDMRINVRLIAILAGILMIGQIGSFLARAGFHTSGLRSRNNSQGQLAIGVVGLALLVVGYIGVFFGRLIQAGVSRQREMLADASAVQFTRNPEGIGGALYKIGFKGSYLETTSHASDMNHMCFGEAAKMSFTALLASHPPIKKRIEAIQPGLLARLRSRIRDSKPSGEVNQWDGQPASSSNAVPQQASGFSSGSTSPLASSGGAESTPRSKAAEAVGAVSLESEVYAAALIKKLPATFRNLLYTRAGAIQFCYALIIQPFSAELREKALALLPNDPLFRPDPGLKAKLLPVLEQLGPEIRVPSLELAMPALRKLDPEERTTLIRQIEQLIAANQKISLFELTVHSFLSRHLSAEATRSVPVKFRKFKAVERDLTTLFSLLATRCSDDPADQDALFSEAMAGFTGQSGSGQRRQSVSMKELREALRRLNGLSPMLKPAVIDACSHCILKDGKVRTDEYELLRLVADQLDCPMPLLKI